MTANSSAAVVISAVAPTVEVAFVLLLDGMWALLVLVLTRDGVVHRLQDGREQSTEAAPRASAVAALAGGRLATLADGRITIVGGPAHARKRVLPGRLAGVRALAGDGARLYALDDRGVLAIDVASGRPSRVAEVARAHRLAVDGALFVEADGVVRELGTAHAWTLPGHVIALAAGDGKLWAATREGPLYEVERRGGRVRVLPLGDWFGTLGLGYGGGALWAVTVAGKLWTIDPAHDRKTIVAMDGWQTALDLAVAPANIE